MQRTDYRFTLTRDTDTFEVTPLGFFEGSFRDEQAEGQLFFRRKFNGDLIFRGYDYTYLKARYDLGNYCDIYEILIEKKTAGVYGTVWNGYFSMTDGKFDFEKCRFTVTPTLQDKYNCLLDNWENEVNILQQYISTITSKTTTFFLFTELFTTNEADLSTTVYVNKYGTSSFAFDLIYKQYLARPVGSPQWFGLYACEAKYIKIGEIPLGSGWTYNATIENYDVYLRDFSSYNILPITGQALFTPHTALIGSDYSTMKVQNPNDLGYSGNWFKCETGLNPAYDSVWLLSSYYSGAKIDEDNTYNYRCISLNESIKYLLGKTCPDNFPTPVLISEFLTNATNPVTGIASKTNNLYLSQKSDIKRPNASNVATIGNLSFKQLMESLYNIFQLWWYINDDSELVIVHQSEIENIAGIDITALPYLLTTAHKKAIEFDKSLLYRFEKWQFMEANGIDFVGTMIEYNELCTIKDSANKTKNYDIPLITTDLPYVQTNVDKISDEGFVLLATDGTDVLMENGLISGSSQLNGHLSLANLHYNYWQHNRILLTGLMNGIAETFISTQKIRKLTEQEITYCGEFDPLEQVTTELGDAKVNEAEFFPSNNRLVLNMNI